MIKKDFDSLSKEVQWAICTSISEQIAKDSPQVFESPLEIQFIVNGIQLDIEKVFVNLVFNYDTEVEKLAQQLANQKEIDKLEVHSRLQQIIDLLENAQNSLHIWE